MLLKLICLSVLPPLILPMPSLIFLVWLAQAKLLVSMSASLAPKNDVVLGFPKSIDALFLYLSTGQAGPIQACHYTRPSLPVGRQFIYLFIFLFHLLKILKLIQVGSDKLTTPYFPSELRPQKVIPAQTEVASSRHS